MTLIKNLAIVGNKWDISYLPYISTTCWFNRFLLWFDTNENFVLFVMFSSLLRRWSPTTHFIQFYMANLSSMKLHEPKKTESLNIYITTTMKRTRWMTGAQRNFVKQLNQSARQRFRSRWCFKMTYFSCTDYKNFAQNYSIQKILKYRRK